MFLVVTGDSAFDKDLLREMIDENQEAQKRAQEAIHAAEYDFDKEENRIKYMEFSSGVDTASSGCYTCLQARELNWPLAYLF